MPHIPPTPPTPQTLSTPQTPPTPPGARSGGSRPVVGLVAITCSLGLTASIGLTSLAEAAPSSPTTSTHATLRSANKARAFGSGTMGWRNEERNIASGVRAQQRLADNTRLAAKKRSGVLGIDVASYQGNVRWSSYRAAGKQFAYVKATEGTRYRNPYFSSQYNGAARAGLYRGAYHFAAPSRTSGAVQADYFIAHGGAWHKDGRTLPGVLDIEYNPYGSTCYGLSKASMVKWIKSFTVRYKQRTGSDAVIYTTTDWWSRCTGNSTAFNHTNPLWVARYASKVGTLPGRWPFYTFWQYSSTPIDQDQFSAPASRLRVLARA